MGDSKVKIDGLSFCIRSSGARDKFLAFCIQSIHALRIEIPYEVLVYGHTGLESNQYAFTLIEGRDDALNARYGKMLNKLAEKAQFSFIVYLDDDSQLFPFWWDQVQKLDFADFDLTPFKLYQVRREQDKFEDWYDWAEVIPGKSVLKSWTEPANDRTYIGTGALIVRREVVLKVRFDEFHGGGEDSKFSFECFKQGYRLRAYPFMRHAICIHFLVQEGRNAFKL